MSYIVKTFQVVKYIRQGSIYFTSCFEWCEWVLFDKYFRLGI